MIHLETTHHLPEGIVGMPSAMQFIILTQASDLLIALSLAIVNNPSPSTLNGPTATREYEIHGSARLPSHWWFLPVSNS